MAISIDPGPQAASDWNELARKFGAQPGELLWAVFLAYVKAILKAT